MSTTPFANHAAAIPFPIWGEGQGEGFMPGPSPNPNQANAAVPAELAPLDT